jgi:hypothetical protein
MKICPVEAELYQVERQTRTMKLTVACRNFANTSKNVQHADAPLTEI